MTTSKIQSLFVVTSFVTFVMISGMCLGLTAVSALSQAAEPMTSISSHNLSADYYR